jgi:hypothetical protein
MELWAIIISFTFGHYESSHTRGRCGRVQLRQGITKRKVTSYRPLIDPYLLTFLAGDAV